MSFYFIFLQLIYVVLPCSTIYERHFSIFYKYQRFAQLILQFTDAIVCYFPRLMYASLPQVTNNLCHCTASFPCKAVPSFKRRHTCSCSLLTGHFILDINCMHLYVRQSCMASCGLFLSGLWRTQQFIFPAVSCSQATLTQADSRGQPTVYHQSLL